MDKHDDNMLTHGTRPSDRFPFLSPPPTLTAGWGQGGGWLPAAVPGRDGVVGEGLAELVAALGSEVDPMFPLMSERSLGREHHPPAWL